MLQAHQQVPVRIEDADSAQARSMIFIFGAGIALGEGDDDIAADILNSEGNEIRWEGRVLKTLFSKHALKAAVVDFDISGFEVGGVDPGAISSVK